MNHVDFEPVSLLHGFPQSEFDALLVKLSEMGCADIAVETGKPVWAKLHGRQFKASLRAVQDFEVRAILTWMYGANAVAEISKGKAIDKRYEIVADDGSCRRTIFRMNAVGCYTGRGGGGISISLRTIPSVVPTLDEMALPDELRAALHPGLGLVLVVGETGSGKSTLLAATHRHTLENIPDKKLVTYEAPIEFDLQGIVSPVNSFASQREVGDHVPSFSAGMVNALRQNPDIIMIGEARDRETIAGMFAAAESGHVTYATVHAESVSTTFLRVANEFPPEQMSQIIFKLVSYIRLVVVQRLAQPAVEGQRRVALREWLVFDTEFRRRLMKMTALEAVAAIDDAVKGRKQTLADQARAAFNEGRISEGTMKMFAGDVS